MILTNKPTSNFEVVSDGIHPAVCCGVIDLGPQHVEFNGEAKTQNKLKLVWEVEETTADGVRKTVSKNYTASVHPKANLARDLAAWRGRPIAENESIDFGKLIGQSCTLVITTQENAGKKRTFVQTVSKPTKKITASGAFKIEETVARLREWSAKNNPKHDDKVFASQLGETTETKPAAPAQGLEYDAEVGF